MADILLKRNSTLAATYVPNTFIDEYMTHADGEFVKIYLYLLRCMASPDTLFSISDVADKFEHTEKDVTRALKYWEKMNLLRLEFNSRQELIGICMSDMPSRTMTPQPVAPVSTEPTADTGSSGYIGPEAAARSNGYPVPEATANSNGYSVPEAAANSNGYPDPAASAGSDGTGLEKPPDRFGKQAGCTQARRVRLPERTEYTRNQLMQFNEDETVKELLFVSERYLGHPLNNTEIQMILYWLDKLQFSQDLIEYLIEQCVAKNHMSIRYMDKIALSWAEAGIHTLSGAKEASFSHNHTVYAVLKAFGISNRTLAGGELEFVQKWSKEWGFSDEIISLACQKTILSIHQVSFDYAHSILKSWKDQNVRTLNDIRLLDAQYQEVKAKKFAAAKAGAARTAKGTVAGGFANFSQRTYNYEELERELLSHVR